MTFFDLSHGYQPFKDPNLHFDWVEKNLKNVFLPTSKAMTNGYVKRGVQVQGWTLEAWMNSTEETQALAETVISNLKIAESKKYIEFGFSGYSHPILPILTDDLIRLQLIFDYNAVTKHLGAPTWFWPPEGAININLLKILYELYPKTIVVVPDISVNRRNFSGFVKIMHEDGRYQKAFISNNILKDILMNAIFYEHNPYKDITIDWDDIQNIYTEKGRFYRLLQEINTPDPVILTRDWENAGSVKGLIPTDNGGLEHLSLMDNSFTFKLPSEASWDNAETIDIKDIVPGCWETDASPNNPYIYWRPNKESDYWKNIPLIKQIWVNKWNEYIDEFNDRFSVFIGKNGGIDTIVNDSKLSNDTKQMIAGLLSCVPWHFLANPQWGPDQSFSMAAWENICKPSREMLLNLTNTE